MSASRLLLALEGAVSLARREDWSDEHLLDEIHLLHLAALWRVEGLGSGKALLSILAQRLSDDQATEALAVLVSMKREMVSEALDGRL